MMKRCIPILLVLVLVLCFVPSASANWTGGHDVMGIPEAKTTWYFAEGCTRSGFNSWLCMYNPNSYGTDTTISYFLENGEVRTVAQHIQANSRATVDIGLTCYGEHDVASKVTSQYPIVAERSVYFDSGGCTGGHVAMGVQSPQRDWYFAEGCTQPGFQEWLCILNSSSTHVASLNAEYQIEGQGPAYENISVKPNSRFTRNIKDFLGEGKNISIKVVGSSSEDLTVCERPIYFNYQGKWNGGHTSPGVNRLSADWLFAEGCTINGFDTWLTLQNPSTQNANVKATYMLGTGQNINKEYKIPPTSRRTVNVAQEVGINQDVSTALKSDIPIAAERPMYFVYHNKWDGGSDSFGATETATSMLFAEGCSRHNFETWVCIQNPNKQEANAILTFSKENGEQEQARKVIPANTRVTLNANDIVGEEHDFAIKVSSNIGVVVERPMYFDYMGKAPTPPPPPTYIYDFNGGGNGIVSQWKSPAIGLQQGLTTFDYSIKDDYKDGGILVMNLTDQAGQTVSAVSNDYVNMTGGRCISVPAAGNYFLSLSSIGKWTVHIEQPRPVSAQGLPQSFQGLNNKHTEFFTVAKGVIHFGTSYGGDDRFTVTIYKTTGEKAVLEDQRGPILGYGVSVTVPAGIYILDVYCGVGGDWIMYDSFTSN